MRPFFSQKLVLLLLLLLHLLTFGVFVVCQRWPVKMPDFTCQVAKLHVLSCPTSHVIFAFYPAYERILFCYAK